MSIVAMDGKSVVPTTVSSFMLLTGQRIDITVKVSLHFFFCFFVSCNVSINAQADQETNVYFLRASAYHHHGLMPGMKGKTGTMIIRYRVRECYF